MTATCLHCGGDCRLTDGAEIYPHRPDLAEKQIWKCDPCQSWVRCHDGTKNPLGYAADGPTRDARIKLHHLMLDPLWLNEPDRKDARRRTYRFLARALGIERDECHDARRSAAQKATTDRKNRNRGHRLRRASRNDVKPITGPLFCPKQAALNEVPW